MTPGRSLHALWAWIFLSIVIAATHAGGRGKSPVTVDVLIERVAEGEQAVVRVAGESSADRATRIALRVEGEARLGEDYVLPGVDLRSFPDIIVTLPQGVESIDIAVEVEDDEPAESDERIVFSLQPGRGYTIDDARGRASLTIPANDFAVTSTNDSGEGSLRQAILNANAHEGPDVIVFDTEAGTFDEPQTIELQSDLPELLGEVTLDGYVENRLWSASGVTVSGAGERRVFRVAEGARATVRSMTVAEGRADDGAGILNHGFLVVTGVTFSDNVASANGGGIANLGGDATVVNSTFFKNSAGRGGGGLANLAGSVTVTNSTFSENDAQRGAGLASEGSLLLRNTILANSSGGADCAASGPVDPQGTSNLIESDAGCGGVVLAADPRLESFGYYNGPAKTLPLNGGSPAINLGDNDSAVGEDGERLVWDQRGDGDPRFVAGFTDIGAFEHQRFPTLVVDTVEDNGLMGCTPSGTANCPLRAAILLADATNEPDIIVFDPDVFDEPRTIRLSRPLPTTTTAITLDATQVSEVTLAARGDFRVFDTPCEALETEGVRIGEEGAEAPGSPGS